jgi:uncharacterized membrane protein
MKLASLALSLCASLVLLAAGCGGEDEEEGSETGSTCPADSTLTYESFGAPFMEAYCTRCHSSDVAVPDRGGAPTDVNFDTLDGILAEADEIDELAAAGPDSVNSQMPPSDPRPSEAERRQLGEWLACETGN